MDPLTSVSIFDLSRRQQASSLIGSAKQTETAAKADDASKTASNIVDSGAKEGKAQAEAAQHTLAELTEEARSFVGQALNSANEYIKPQGEQAQGLVNNARATASGLVEQVSQRDVAYSTCECSTDNPYPLFLL